MGSHCHCSGKEQDHYRVEISPGHYDGETWVTKCNTCGGLVKVH